MAVHENERFLTPGRFDRDVTSLQDARAARKRLLAQHLREPAQAHHHKAEPIANQNKRGKSKS